MFTFFLNLFITIIFTYLILYIKKISFKYILTIYIIYIKLTTFNMSIKTLYAHHKNIF